MVKNMTLSEWLIALRHVDLLKRLESVVIYKGKAASYKITASPVIRTD